MPLKSLQSLRAFRAGMPAAVLTGLLAACSGSGPQQDDASAAPPAPADESTPPAAETAPAGSEQAPAGESMAGAAPAGQAGPGPALSPTAPQTYTVRVGDTLWDIARTFLQDPWYWPEVWYINPQVENPHLIYPGDVLALAHGADGRPQVRLQTAGATRLSPKVRSTPLEGAIRAIPYEIVAAFMSRPAVLEKGQIRAAPHILSSRDQHLAMASGNTVYARGDLSEEPNTRYSVMRAGDPLVDPDDNDVVGYEGIYTATARLTRPGDPATLVLTESTRETFEGDRLFAADTEVAQDFVPRAPEGDVEGQIISIVDGISIVGQYQVVVINRGKKHGLEPGHVLTIEERGAVVRDKHAGMGGVFSSRVRLPSETAGTFMVFKTFDRISYGLIMQAQAPIRVTDRVVSP